MTTDPKDSVDELFGALILRRKMLKWSVKQVADCIGMDRDKLSLMENGHINPPLRALAAYADAVGLELEWTLKGRR